MVKINIEKKYLVLVGAVFVFLIGTGLVFGALGETPTGAHHLLNSIQGYFSGDANLDVSLGKLQERVSGTCAVGSSIRAISSTGTVTCEPDDVGSSVNLDELQKRVSGTCAVGSSIRAISSTGEVTCEPHSSLDCVRAFSLGNPSVLFSGWYWNDVECPEGRIVVGGGCWSGDYPTYPLLMGTSRLGTKNHLQEQAWYCAAGGDYSASLSVYAICCK